jgi:RNA polymerase sigma factor (sigma-70 family)
MAPRATKQTALVTNDTEQVQRAIARDAGAFRAIMQTHNRRLYRIARSILRNNADAEDAVQEAYVSAFTDLASYRGEGTLKSWLSRIVINESLGRMRQRHLSIDFATLEQQQGEAQIVQFPQSTPNDDSERTMAQRQIIQLVEQATDNLPEAFRMVFVTRVIEDEILWEGKVSVHNEPGTSCIAWSPATCAGAGEPCPPGRFNEQWRWALWAAPATPSSVRLHGEGRGLPRGAAEAELAALPAKTYSRS